MPTYACNVYYVCLPREYIVSLYIQCHISLHGLATYLLSISVSANQDSLQQLVNHMPIG